MYGCFASMGDQVPLELELETTASSHVGAGIDAGPLKECSSPLSHSFQPHVIGLGLLCVLFCFGLVWFICFVFLTRERLGELL